MLLVLILLNLFASIGAESRQRRYLVYPDGGPARAQFIVGLGIPVDLKEQSVTVGAVLKFQYDLPTNSSEYTSRIYGFANTVSRNIDGGGDDDNEPDNQLNMSNEEINYEDSLVSNDDSERDNDTLVDITFNKDRKRRSLAYSEGGVINNIDNEVTTELPLQKAIEQQEAKDKSYLQDDEPQRMNRWDFYKIIEHMAERYGYMGRPCLLRTICEAAQVPFTHEHGLLGEIGHILFTPSTTRDAVSHHSDNEYHAAERLGRAGREGRAGRAGGEDSCERLFPECRDSLLDTFTDIGVDTLHTFGL